jgi:H/ACA ribonucleoprotein complex subunit 2
MAKKAKHVVADDQAEDNNATEMETASPVKVKKEKDSPSYDELLNHVSVIAKPMASRKLTKKVYKLLKKG